MTIPTPAPRRGFDSNQRPATAPITTEYADHDAAPSAANATNRR